MSTVYAPVCRNCGRHYSTPLGVVQRPGKCLGLMCRRCWEKSPTLAAGHGYRWSECKMDQATRNAVEAAIAIAAERGQAIGLMVSDQVPAGAECGVVVRIYANSAEAAAQIRQAAGIK